MTDYEFPKVGPGFPEIRRYQRPDGRFCAEWTIEHTCGASAFPLRFRCQSEVDVELSVPSENVLQVTLVSDKNPTLPDVYSVFYHLIRPAFERGLITSIEGGDLDVHRFIVEGTEDL